MSEPHEQSLGRYRLLSLIGEGGMGQVYKAYDAALDRHVAIKVLPEELLTDSDRVGRFIQEARAASALNHPHVVAVYDIGEANNVRYIAMELIDGKTLREVGADTPVDLRKALKAVMQVAEALTAAHAAGIVHRDLKPENIMITSGGYAKVLDFGLAKLRIAAEETPGDTSRTVARATNPGTVMGTAGYMSPEQAQAKTVDHRSDLFSLGCVLYELVTGRRAFHGTSSVDTLHKIIYSDPEPVRALRPDTPPELIRIIRKALAKEPDERYQTARDLAIDLRELLREMESNPSGVAITAPALAAPAPAPWIWGAALGVAILLIAAFIYLPRRPRSEAAAKRTPLQMARVTASGKVIDASVSPDGKFVSYVVSDRGEQTLWVKQMSSGQSLQLMPPQRGAYWGLVFAPDGSIYFGLKDAVNVTGAIFQISALGGTARKIITGIDSSPAFSPDGKRMAFLRARTPTPDHSALIVANADGTEERVLTSIRAPELFVPIFFAKPTWSPDGKVITTAVANRAASTAYLAVIDLSSGSIKRITTADWREAASASWMPDGRGLVCIALGRADSSPQVWFVTYPEGKASPITSDLSGYRSVSVTADGRMLLTVASDETSDLWLAANGAPPKQLTRARMEGGHGLSVTADQHIVFTSLESGKSDIWVMKPDGTGRTALTRDEFRNRAPAVTADGRSIAYISVTPNGTFVCRINGDGSGRRVLAPTHPEGGVDISPDGKWVAYEMVDIGGGRFRHVVARVPIDGGTPQVLTERASNAPAYSPDGSKIALYLWDERQEQTSIAVIPAEGGAPIWKMDATYPSFRSRVAWSADAKALILNTEGKDRGNLWLQPLDNTAARRLTPFDDRTLMAFARLPDGTGWMLSRGDLSRDAVLLTGFDPR